MNKTEIDHITNYVKPPKPPITIKKIQSMLNVNNEANANRWKIISFLKSSLNYSFKRGSSTTVKGGSRKVQIQQAIFSWRILKEILFGKYIINIDESWF